MATAVTLTHDNLLQSDLTGSPTLFDRKLYYNLNFLVSIGAHIRVGSFLSYSRQLSRITFSINSEAKYYLLDVSNYPTDR